MNKYESFTILLDNLSPFFVFIMFTTIFTIVITFCFIKYMASDDSKKEKGKNENNEDENNSELENDEGIKQKDLGSGLLGQLRAAKIKKLEESLTEEQKEEERNIEKEQLAVIYKLLKEQETQYKMGELNEIDLEEQLKLYR